MKKVLLLILSGILLASCGGTTSTTKKTITPEEKKKMEEDFKKNQRMILDNEEIQVSYQEDNKPTKSVLISEAGAKQLISFISKDATITPAMEKQLIDGIIKALASGKFFIVLLKKSNNAFMGGPMVIMDKTNLMGSVYLNNIRQGTFGFGIDKEGNPTKF